MSEGTNESGGVARRARAAALGLVLAGSIVGAAFVVGRGQDAAGVAFAGDLRIGGRLEELRLPRLEGDGVVEYASLGDRPLVINFFASWCAPCVAEMPEFERVHQALGTEVAILGVSQSDPRAASIELVRRTGVTYPTAIDENGAFFRAVGAFGMPTTVLVRPGGEISEIWVGPLDERALRGLIAEHLGAGV